VRPVLAVFLYGLITALATGLGAVPFALLRTISPSAVALANAVAGGLMLGASFGIVAEGTEYGALQTLAGGLLGVVFILVTQRHLGDPDGAVADAATADTRRITLILIVMTIHSFAEGVAVGVSFGGGATLALAITLAIAVHNIPEGLAISAVMRPRGATVLACAGWSIFSSLPQPIMAVPAFLFVDTFRAALPYGLGFAAGAMVFMVLEELLPEAYDRAKRARVAVVVSLTLVGMMLFQQTL
jgi:zinc transporter ZupT